MLAMQAVPKHPWINKFTYLLPLPAIIHAAAFPSCLTMRSYRFCRFTPLVRISDTNLLMNVTDALRVKSVNSDGILLHLHAGDTGNRPLPDKPRSAAKRAEIPQLPGHYR